MFYLQPWIISLVVTCVVTPSFACLCRNFPADWEQSMTRSSFAIQAKVTDAWGPVRIHNNGTVTRTNDEFYGDTIYQIHVEKVFKADPAYWDAYGALVSTNAGSLCGVSLDVGKSYKLTGFVENLGDTPNKYLRTGLCQYVQQLD